MKTFSQFFAIVALLLMVGLACSFGRGGAQPTAQNRPTAKTPTVKKTTVKTPTAKTPTAKKTTAKKPTTEPKATRQATNPATGTPDAQNTDSTTATPDAQNPEGEQYFTDTFAGNMDSYTVQNRKKSSDENKMDVSITDGSMLFDLKGTNLWVYVTYNLFEYQNVKISMTATNHGNNNNVTLFCRQSDEGWYEFSIANSRSYWIYAYDATGAIAKGYNTIFTGSSTAIKQGKETNEYAATCIGDKLTLSINGTEVKTIKDTKFKFGEGAVGFGVSSFGVTPVLVDVNEFTVSEP